MMLVGVDASTIIEGGGVAQLRYLVKMMVEDESVSRVDVWIRKDAQCIDGEDNKVLWRYIEDETGKQRFFVLIRWLTNKFPQVARRENYDEIVSVCGFNVGHFACPVTVVIQSLLPFSPREILRYLPDTGMILRLLTLFCIYSISALRSTCIIVPSISARESMWFKRLKKISVFSGERFVDIGLRATTRRRDGGSPLNSPRAVNLIYISRLDVYKHQLLVYKAVDAATNTASTPLPSVSDIHQSIISS